MYKQINMYKHMNKDFVMNIEYKTIENESYINIQYTLQVDRFSSLRLHFFAPLYLLNYLSKGKEKNDIHFYFVYFLVYFLIMLY